jgi:hypothetical protein
VLGVLVLLVGLRAFAGFARRHGRATGEEDACVLAGSPEGGEGMAGALDDLWRYWRAFSDLPPPAELMALLEWVFSGRGLYLYAR